MKQNLNAKEKNLIEIKRKDQPDTAFDVVGVVVAVVDDVQVLTIRLHVDFRKVI